MNKLTDPLASQPISTAISRDAERVIMRRLLCTSLPGGEAEYWRLVREEIEQQQRRNALGDA